MRMQPRTAAVMLKAGPTQCRWCCIHTYALMSVLYAKVNLDAGAMYKVLLDIDDAYKCTP